jgi:hypothetical protein
MDEVSLTFRDNTACGNSSWQVNQVAYVQASTDDQMREWWASVPHVNFANQLGDDFGAHESAFASILAIVFGIGAFWDPTPEGKALSAGIAGAGGLINAGVTMDVNNLQPNPASPLNTIQDMQNYCQNISQGMRNTIATWANTTFLGGEDANHQTIL